MDEPQASRNDAGRRENAATPVFDPASAPAGTDAEAGGARVRPLSERPPLSPRESRADGGGAGMRLTPRVWLIAAAVALGALLVAGIASM